MADQTEALLMREVSVPAFFEKLAADTGVDPAGDPSLARTLLDLGDAVAPAVGLYVRKQAAAGRLRVEGGVNAAAAAALGPVRAEATPAARYLEVPGVRDAALLVAEALRKDAAAKAANPLPMPTPPTGETEEEEEKEREKKPAA